MQITSRRKTTAFFLILGISLVVAAIALNVSWVILHWRQGVLLFFGVVFFAAIIAGLILHTVFLVREIRRNERHDSFINAVTHELKTPIASIRLYLETLQRREVDEAQRRQFYGLMLEDSDRLLGTVEQVLKAGEVGYTRKARDLNEVDFAGLVDESMELARTRYHLPHAALHWEGTNISAENGAQNGNQVRSQVHVKGDPNDLRTAISNIFDNAIKYSGGTVDVSVRIETPGDKPVAILHVRDCGIGIPPQELKRIFKRFYRVSGRSFSQVKGTGLGLFIVRAIARAHGGKVSAQSGGEERGTTVSLELPRSRA